MFVVDTNILLYAVKSCAAVLRLVRSEEPFTGHRCGPSSSSAFSIISLTRRHAVVRE